MKNSVRYTMDVEEVNDMENIIDNYEEKFITNKIKEIAREIQQQLVDIRRHLHQHPELGFEEIETSKFITQILYELELDIKTEVAGTGVVGTLYGSKPGKTIAIRADMDALPIEELNSTSYTSKYKGKMHACGHDAHITFAIGTAIILSKIKEYISGNVKFIFQPAEETTGGAKPMIEAGVLENPKVDAIIGGHVWGGIPSGKVAVKNGAIMASPDIFSVKLIGKGGHAAQPHKAIDPIIIGSDIVNAFQKIVSRQIDPLDSVVISICTFQSGDAFNVIPNEALLKGTVRTLNDEVRRMLPSKMENIIKNIVNSYGGKYDFVYKHNYPITINNTQMTELIKRSSMKILGKDNVEYVKSPSMGGEDFSYFLQEVPGTFMWIGNKNQEKGIIYDIHHPRFDIDEDIIASIAAVYAQTVLDYLNSDS